MQVTVEDINSVTKKISIEIPAERVDAEITKTFITIQKKAKLEGFRPGKAPLQLIKRSYQDAMSDKVTNNFIRETLFKALDEHKIDPVETPVIESDPLEPGTPFKYSAVVEVIPVIVLNDYKGLEITKEKFVLDSAKIEGEIKRMQENMAQLEPVEDGTVENGHVVTIDYSFSVDGFPEESSKAEDAELEVGSNKMVPGFEEQLLGLSCGQEKEIRITLPEGYRTKDAAGKEGVFRITLKEIKRKELPELDDEFAQQFGEYENMSELRAKMTEYLEKQEIERIDSDLKESVIAALIKKNPLEVPKSMIDKQLEYMLENLKNRLKKQRMSIESMGLDEKGFRQRFRSAAEEKVKGGLLLMELVEKEKIEVADEDLAQRYEQMAAGNPEMLERVKDYYTSNKKALNSLMSEIKEDNAIRFLIDAAVVTEVEKKEEAIV